MLATVVLLNPFKTTVVLWRFVAVSMIIGAVMDLVILVFINQDNKGNKKEDSTEIM